MGKIFQILFYQPIFNILIIFYDLFKGNLGLAIIAVAVLSRLVTYPITKAQIKAAEKGKEFQKKFADVKKKYGKNKEKLNEEMAKLQAKYLPSQLSGCLPIIILIILLIQIRGGIVNLVDKATFDNVILVGPDFKKVAEERFICFTTSDEARDWLLKQQLQNYTILVKGSRGIKMEKVLEVL